MINVARASGPPAKPTFRTSEATNAAVRKIHARAVVDRDGRRVSMDAVIAAMAAFVSSSPEAWAVYLQLLDA